MRQFKLERIRNMFARKDMRAAYDKWKEGALKIQGMDNAATRLVKTEHKRRMRIWFQRLRANTRAKKREQNIESRCDWLTLTRHNHTLKDCWLGWKHHLRTTNLARKFMDRAMRGMARNSERDAFMKWKQCCAQTIQMAYMEDLEQLNNNIEEQKMEIKNKKKEVEACESGRMHITHQAKTLSNKVLANYMVRLKHAGMSKGFYTWLEVTKSQNQTRRDLKKMINYWMKNQLAMGFRTWVDIDHGNKKAELNKKLNKKEHERLDQKEKGR